MPNEHEQTLAFTTEMDANLDSLLQGDLLRTFLERPHGLDVGTHFDNPKKAHSSVWYGFNAHVGAYIAEHIPNLV